MSRCLSLMPLAKRTAAAVSFKPGAVGLVCNRLANAMSETLVVYIVMKIQTFFFLCVCVCVCVWAETSSKVYKEKKKKKS